MEHRNVKIVATLGPSSASNEMIAKLVSAGANVFRLNMSHGDHQAIKDIHGKIRALEKQIEQPICILADLQGPKLRVGTFANPKGEVLKNGQKFRLDLDETPGDDTRVGMPHPEIFAALRKNAVLLINDGQLRLHVTKAEADHCICTVEVGGKISDRKGVNVPSVVLPLSALSKKDLADMAFVLDLGVDWLALSFVQRVEDVTTARELVAGRAKILSKIEKPAALDEFDKILDASDAIMVARGDLGVELPLPKVPWVQKMLIKKCRQAGKPVIVATQMLESMIMAPMPTRAEVSDVALAINDGADAVMLSAESAAGKYPEQAVAMMHAIAIETESNEDYRKSLNRLQLTVHPNIANAITAAVREIAETADIKAICCVTQSGTTALLAARERPRVPILALTTSLKTARQLTLVWGLRCIVVDPVDRFRHAVKAAINAARACGVAEGSQKVVITAGIPFNTPGSTNIIRVAAVDASDINLGT